MIGQELRSGAWLELFSAKAIISWCLISRYLGRGVFNPQIYEVTFRTMTPDEWQGIGMLFGLSQITCCLLNYRLPRIITCFVTCSYWSLLGYSIKDMDSNVLGIVFYVEFALMNAVATVILLRPRANGK